MTRMVSYVKYNADTFQEAIQAGCICSFTGPARFLSNFDLRSLRIGDNWFKTREHAFQCAKFVIESAAWREVYKASSPAKAKYAARNWKTSIDSDWYQGLRNERMQEVVFTFFSQWPDKRKLLLLTGECELIEGNNWGDTYWGVCGGEGENWLGRILMWTRARLSEDPYMPLEVAVKTPL